MKRNYQFIAKINREAVYLPSVILYQPPVFEPMLLEVDNEGVVIRSTDVTLLFNQERLEKELGLDTLKHVIDSINNNKVKDQFAEIRSQVPDDALDKFIKSRHYQSPSELKSWANYLMYNFEKEYEDYQEKRSEALKKHEEEARKLRDKELEEYLQRKNESK